ncbi:MAG: flagellar biosynthesis protein FlhF, partial [Acidithiobacillus sp.]
MKIKRFSGSSTRDVLQQIRMSLGPDAVILSNRDVNGEVEIVAAIDFDEQQCTEAHATPTWPGPLQVGDLSPTPEPQVSSLQRTVATPETSVPVVSSVAPTSPLRSELQALRQLVEKRWG